MSSSTETAVTLAGLIDLAAERIGGKALLASDEFFARKENLLKPGRGVFLPDKYTERGKWMDGWESRRRRDSGHDWCIISLGFPGTIKAVDIDTNHFLGNHPTFASVEAANLAGTTAGKQLLQVAWSEILPLSPLKPGLQNIFFVGNDERWNHIRLNIHPDGGVARLRVYGDAAPDWSTISPDTTVDLAFVGNGGKVVAASDMFFGSKENLIMPGRATTMGEGWETKRRRGSGNDWAILQLGRPGIISKIEVDTNHFKGNYPDRCSIDGVHAPGASIDVLTRDELAWSVLLPETKLHAHKRHFFERELKKIPACSHIRLNIFPDGGVSRLRVLGRYV